MEGKEEGTKVKDGMVYTLLTVRKIEINKNRYIKFFV